MKQNFIIALFAATLFLVTKVQGQTSTAPATGDGSSGNPYQIETLENLYWIAEDNTRWAFNYRQTADIDASETETWNSGAGWTPIGNSSVKFTGNYDGLYYKIINLFINRSASNYQGFFGYTEGSRIENIFTENIIITGNQYVAGIVGYANLNTEVFNCHVNGTIAASQHAGGIVGHLNNSSSVEMCSANVSIRGKFSVGGLVGQSGASSSIYQCYSRGSVTATSGEESYYFGGIVGYNNASISSCYSNCNVVSGMESGGGFVGLNTGSIYGCYSTGNVTSGDLYGGFAGSNSGTVSSCYWDTELSGNASSAAGTGKTSAEMKTQSTYEGWDFEMFPEWQISSRYYKGYPSLGWMPCSSAPMVITTSVDNVTGTTASITGEIDGLGLTDPSQHGFCWSTSLNPTVDDNKVELGSVTDFTSFSATIEGLSTNSTYYIRAYATNSHGTSYGNLKSFKTFILAGLGTTEDPYQIATLEQLKYVADNSSLWSKSFIQTANIDATETSTWNGGEGWNPIGSGGTYFTGIYNGNGKSITGIFINRPTTSVQGLFSVISSATVNNIFLENVQITGKDYVGGLAGSAISNALIQNCMVTGDISGGQHVGGIAGWSNLNTQIEMCYVIVNVTGSWSTGGLVGTNNSTSAISMCSSFGNVYGSYTLGGAVGNNSGTISNSYSRCNTSSGDIYGGGFVSQNNGTITNCYSTGNTNGSIYSGFVENNSGTVNNCFWNKETSECPYSDGGTGITSALMSIYSTFTNATWDFKGFGTEGIWNIGNARNDGFPYLYWEYPDDKALQEIIFSSLTSKVYGDSDFELSASSTSGLPVAFTSSDENIATISGTTVTIVGAGDVDITASQSGDETYNPASSIVRSLSVSKADLTATADGKSRNYGAENPELTISYTGFVNGDDETDITEPTVQTDAIATSVVGFYDITLSGGSSSNYNFSLVDAELEITKAPLTVTAENKSKVYDGQTFLSENFTAIYSGFVNSEDESVLTGTLGFTGDATTAVNAGNYTITPEGFSADNYEIEYVDGTLEISKVDLTVTAVNKTRIYGAENPTFTLSYSGFVNDEDETQITNPDASTLADLSSPVGNYSITLSGGSADNYNITLVDGELEITQAPLTVEAQDKSKTYDGNIFPNENFTVSYTGFKNSENQSVLAGTLTYAGSAIGAVNAGSYEISPSGLSADNYAITFESGLLTISKAPLTVTAENKSKVYDGQVFAAENFTSTISGFVNSENENVLTGTLTYSGTAVGAANAGNYQIEPQGFSAENYSINFINGTLEIAKVPLTIASENKSKDYDGQIFPTENYTVNYSGFVNNEDESVLNGTLVFEGTALTAVNAGTYSITPNGKSADNYSINFTNGELIISKVDLTATAENKTRIYGDENPELTISYSGFVNSENETNITEPTAICNATISSSVGVYDIELNGGSADNYIINSVNGELEITKATLTVTAENKMKVYDGVAFPAENFTVAYDGFKNDEDESILSGTLNFSGTATTELNAGNYSIEPVGLTAENYEIDFVNGELQIAKASLTATAEDVSRYEGEENPELTIYYSGFVADESIDVIDELPVAYTDADVDIPAGEYEIVLSGGADNNYEFTLVNGKLTILLQEFTVKFIVKNDDLLISGATISINEQTLTTDSQGEASVNLTNGTYNYTINADDFNSVTGAVTVDGEDETLNVNLIPTGIDANQLFSVNIYPIPFSGVIHFSSPVTLHRISIVSITGQVIANFETNKNNYTANLEYLKSGIYIAIIEDALGNKSNFRIVKE